MKSYSQSDTINRSALLELFEELCVTSFYELNEHSKETYKELKHAVETMPSTDWIPCSEKLPELGVRVWCSTRDKTTNVMSFEGNQWCSDDFPYRIRSPLDYVKAWMPLKQEYYGIVRP